MQGSLEFIVLNLPSFVCDHCLLISLPTDSLYENAWFAPWLTHFQQVSPNRSWQVLVMNWAHFELLNPPDGVSFIYLLCLCLVQRLPTTSRPEEVHWWIKHKRLQGVLPPIKNFSEFGATWMLWWVKMQPAWHEGETLVKTLSVDAGWEPIL
jgi:hypothetical protein